MPYITVHLNIEASEYVRLYQGAVRDAIARSDDGRMVRFPAGILRPFVTHEGVKGCFSIEFDARGKFLAIRRI